MRLDPEIIRQQIRNLIVANPELADDEILRADMVEAETEALDLLARIVRSIEDTKALETGTAERIDELRARKDRFGRRQDSLRDLAFKVMEAAELRKVEMPIATLSIRNGSARVVITDETILPPSCVRTKIEPDKTAIKAQLEAGNHVPGAELSNSPPSLSIRVK